MQSERLVVRGEISTRTINNTSGGTRRLVCCVLWLIVEYKESQRVASFSSAQHRRQWAGGRSLWPRVVSAHRSLVAGRTNDHRHANHPKHAPRTVWDQESITDQTSKGSFSINYCHVRRSLSPIGIGGFKFLRSRCLTENRRGDVISGRWEFIIFGYGITGEDQNNLRWRSTGHTFQFSVDDSIWTGGSTR